MSTKKLHIFSLQNWQYLPNVPVETSHFKTVPDCFATHPVHRLLPGHGLMSN